MFSIIKGKVSGLLGSRAMQTSSVMTKLQAEVKSLREDNEKLTKIVPDVANLVYNLQQKINKLELDLYKVQADDTAYNNVFLVELKNLYDDHCELKKCIYGYIHEDKIVKIPKKNRIRDHVLDMEVK